MADVVFRSEGYPVNDRALDALRAGVPLGKALDVDGCVHDNPPRCLRRIVRAGGA
jgi:hypothetical protein